MSIDRETELFELFGEEGFCTICQNDLQEKELVRCISKCSHLFHSECLENWFYRNPTCPLCRVELAETREIVREQIIQNILRVIQEEIDRLRNDQRRRFLSFIVWRGIVKRLNRASVFEENRGVLEEFFTEESFQIGDYVVLRPVLQNRHQFMRGLGELRVSILNNASTNMRTVPLRNWPEFAEFQRIVTDYANQNQQFQRIWLS